MRAFYFYKIDLHFNPTPKQPMPTWIQHNKINVIAKLSASGQFGHAIVWQQGK